MPYVRVGERKQVRETFFPDLTMIQWFQAADPGILAYALTQMVLCWLPRTGLRYAHLAAAVGALETVKMELYRRVAVPHEDQKKEENGDVY